MRAYLTVARHLLGKTYWFLVSRRMTGCSPGSRRAAWEATAASSPADFAWPAP